MKCVGENEIVSLQRFCQYSILSFFIIKMRPAFAYMLKFNYHIFMKTLLFTTVRKGKKELTNFEPTHTYTTSGVKNLCLFGIDSCMTEVYCDMIVISNPQAISSSMQMDIQFYPNPTKDFLFLEARNLTENKGKIFLYNLLGEVILEKELIVKQGNIKEKIDLRDIPIGMYFLSFQSAHNYHLQKVMKE